MHNVNLQLYYLIINRIFKSLWILLAFCQFNLFSYGEAYFWQFSFKQLCKMGWNLLSYFGRISHISVFPKEYRHSILNCIIESHMLKKLCQYLYKFLSSQSNISVLFLSTITKQDNPGLPNADVADSIFLCTSTWNVCNPSFQTYQRKVIRIKYVQFFIRL